VADLENMLFLLNKLQIPVIRILAAVFIDSYIDFAKYRSGRLVVLVVWSFGRLCYLYY
jgi:hypothetical protein